MNMFTPYRGLPHRWITRRTARRFAAVTSHPKTRLLMTLAPLALSVSSFSVAAEQTFGEVVASNFVSGWFKGAIGIALILCALGSRGQRS